MITSTIPLGTDVGLLVVLDAFAASLCAAYVNLVYVLNSMHDPFCKLCRLLCSSYRAPFIMHVSS